MELNGNSQTISRGFFSLKRALIVIVIFVVGIGIMNVLSGMKKPPKEVSTKEQAIQVEGVGLQFKDYPIIIHGFGEATPITIIGISPEVSGKIIQIHPRLEAGEIISKGELLFSIDPSDFQIVYETGTKRMSILKRNSELTKKEYLRVKNLYENNKVGSLSGVDAAEKAYLSVSDLVSQVEQAVQTAKLNLDRCRIHMPFDGRIKDVSLEKGQYVTPGRHVMTLVDDSVLEIYVSIDSLDVNNALAFKEPSSPLPPGWFSDVEQVACQVRWTENQDGAVWNGTLDRIVRYNDDTHTVTLAVRVKQDAFTKKGHDIPLVEGMFCSVAIPGKTMHQVIKIPRWAVTLEDNVYCAVDNRLKTVPVTVVRAQDSHAFITGEFPEGSTVITTRLVDPLENILLNVTLKPAEEGTL